MWISLQTDGLKIVFHSTPKLYQGSIKVTTGVSDASEIHSIILNHP
jgi:hypothetical protein